MLRCFKCPEFHGSSKSLISHLKFTHGFYPTSKQRLLCNQERCRKQFLTYSGYSKHLESTHLPVNNEEHEQNLGPRGQISDQIDVDLTSSNDYPTSSNDSQTASTDTSENRRPTISSEFLKNRCVSIATRLQDSGAGNAFISSIVSELEEYTTELRDYFQQSTLEAIPTDNTCRNDVKQNFEHFENPVSFLNSESKRLKYLKEKWEVVEPLELTLGVRFDSRLNKNSRMFDQVQVKDTFIYIPILETLKFMFRNADVCEKVKADTTNTHTYEDFKDGSYFKTHPLFSKHTNALQIQLYYDDFETANPLGSKHSIHKLGCLYFILRNLPPKCNSAVMNIHLVSLFHSQDVKRYGYDAILEPLICDIKSLENEGIDLPISPQKVYGTISQILGDNLGLNAILGYNESFSSNYYCRLCAVDKNAAQAVYSEDDPSVVIRDIHSFDSHCRDLNSDPQLRSVYGLKRNSILNTLTYFHVVNNVAVDIMHDLLEGVAQFELKLLFEHLTSSGSISKGDLLAQVYSFDWLHGT